jgi:hypothetical protein
LGDLTTGMRGLTVFCDGHAFTTAGTGTDLLPLVGAGDWSDFLYRIGFEVRDQIKLDGTVSEHRVRRRGVTVVCEIHRGALRLSRLSLLTVISRITHCM